MLADAEVQVAAAIVSRLEVAGAVEFEPGLGRGGQVRRTAHQPGQALGDGVQHLAGGFAAGDALGVGGEARDVGVPASGKGALPHQPQFLGQRGLGFAIEPEGGFPIGMQLAAPRAKA